MFFVLKLLLVVFLLICLFLGIKYIILLRAKSVADKSFLNIFNKLNQLYEDTMFLFSQFSVLSMEDRMLVQNTKKLITEAQSFVIEKDGNERIIGYANAILENVKIFSDSILVKDPENMHISKYIYLLAIFNKAKKDYNRSAEYLRHYVDTFPTSFYARLKKIRTMDYINY